MGLVNNPTYKDYADLLSSNTYLSRKDERELYGIINSADLDIIARRCHQLMPYQLSSKQQQRNAQLAKIGERYTGHCIELWLWEKGYSLNGLSGNSFTIQPQYKQGSHFMDFKIEIATASNTTSLVIDAKNWARYTTNQVQSFMTNTHIPPFSSFTANYKLMFLNKRLIPKVKQLLRNSNIDPIEINEHLTDKQYIKDFFVLITSMKNSIMNLDNIITIPDVSKDISKMTTTDVIKYDVELGKPYKFIELKWGIKKSHMDNLKNQIIKGGINLPHRNKKEFKRLKQYNEFFKRK